MIRILLVASEFPPGPGGIGTHAFELARHLAERGHQVEVLACQHYVDPRARDTFNRSQQFGFTALTDAGGSLSRSSGRLRQVLRAIGAHRPQLIIASGGRAVVLAGAAAAVRRVPWMAVVHGSELGGPPATRTLTRRALHRADAVVAVSHFTRRRALGAGVRARRLEVVANGADPDRFRPDDAAGQRFRAAYGLGTHPVVLTVGNVTERKGQRVVVAALPRLLSTVPDARYVMVGQPTIAASIMELARELGVADHVVVLGQVDGDELAGAYNAADVFAMTSTETVDGDVEGYGIAIVEAALTGVPAVVSAGSGPEEVIEPGDTGISVDPDHPTAVGAALATLLSDPELRRAMGEAARSRALALQTWHDTVVRYEQIITSLVSPHRSTARRLLVVSHTPHHDGPDGVVGFGPTVRELDQLSTLFDELVHVAPLQPGAPPGNALPYRSDRVRHVAVREVGGNRVIDKLRVAGEVPRWAATIWTESGRADAVHVRCPAAISLVALGVLAVRRTPRSRWFKYAGNWRPEQADARAYRVQRWWLMHDVSRGEVSVNGRWPGDPSHIHTFDNPTLTDHELREAARLARSKSLDGVLELIFVGRLEQEKGADRAVEVAEELAARGHQVRLRLIGDGPLMDAISTRGLAKSPNPVVELLGWRTRAEVEVELSTAHVMLLPSTASEGFPKVLGEALAFGVVPVTSDVSSIPQVLGEIGAGAVCSDLSPDVLASQVEKVTTSPAVWKAQSEQGVAGAQRFTYDTYLARVRALARNGWHIDL